MENCRAKLCRKVTSAWHNILPLTDVAAAKIVGRPKRM